MVEMRLSIEGLEKERDFYFGKLRDIEVVIQESADAADPMASKVLEVLYATEVKYCLRSENTSSALEKLTISQTIALSLKTKNHF